MPRKQPDISPEIRAALETYVIALDALMRAHHERNHNALAYEAVTCEVRQKYAKIVIGGHRVYSYVDLATGDVVKGNWKGPERAVMHIKRGNVLDGTWLDWHGPYGLGYANSHGHFRRYLDDASYLVAVDAIQAQNNEGAARILAAAIAARVETPSA